MPCLIDTISIQVHLVQRVHEGYNWRLQKHALDPSLSAHTLKLRGELLPVVYVLRY